jgi:hypothetical protein
VVVETGERGGDVLAAEREEGLEVGLSDRHCG